MLKRPLPSLSSLLLRLRKPANVHMKHANSSARVDFWISIARVSIALGRGAQAGPRSMTTPAQRQLQPPRHVGAGAMGCNTDCMHEQQAAEAYSAGEQNRAGRFKCPTRPPMRQDKSPLAVWKRSLSIRAGVTLQEFEEYGTLACSFCCAVAITPFGLGGSPDADP